MHCVSSLSKVSPPVTFAPFQVIVYPPSPSPQHNPPPERLMSVNKTLVAVLATQAWDKMFVRAKDSSSADVL